MNKNYDVYILIESVNPEWKDVSEALDPSLCSG